MSTSPGHQRHQGGHRALLAGGVTVAAAGAFTAPAVPWRVERR